jgi:hypothetical protein
MGIARRAKKPDRPVETVPTVAERFSLTPRSELEGDSEFLLGLFEKEAEEILHSNGYPNIIAADKALPTLYEKFGSKKFFSVLSACCVICAVWEIRRLIAERDLEGVFFETIRLTTNAIRGKNFPNTLLGLLRREQQRVRGKIRGESIPAVKQIEHKFWREEAEKVRKKKQGASKSTVAFIVKTRLKSSESVRTIRAVI